MTNEAGTWYKCHRWVPRRKALTINNYGKPEARFSPCVGANDGRARCICGNGLDTRGDCPLRLVRPSSFACAYDMYICTCICVFLYLLE